MDILKFQKVTLPVLSKRVTAGNLMVLMAGILLGAWQAEAARSPCEGINVDGEYVVATSCPLDGGLVPAGTTLVIQRDGNESACTFSAAATIIEEHVEYSITPPPGVLRGPYDMCALWSFDEGSRPGSFPEEMKEPCRIWMNRPADRIIKVETDLQQIFQSTDVELDIAGRVSSVGQCRLRRR
jgi:hypothetical protein